MKYYGKLRDQMVHIDDDKLCNELTIIRIITSEDMEFINDFQIYSVELILTRLADNLLSGETGIFYTMLEFLQTHTDVTIHYLFAEIQVELDQIPTTSM